MLVYDCTGTRYDIPPYILNDPLKYGASDNSPRLSACTIEQEISLTFRHSSKGDFKLKVSNYSSVRDTKETYAQRMQLIDSKLRLFYKGQEMIDGSMLGNYEVKDDTVVQVLIS